MQTNESIRPVGSPRADGEQLRPLRRVRDGRNSIHQPGLHGAVPRDEEMAARDALGPRTRRALDDAPLLVLAKPVLDQVLAFNEKNAGLREPLDPQSPGVDEALAKGIRAKCLELVASDVGLERARQGMIPLRAKPRSTRLQRQMVRYK